MGNHVEALIACSRPAGNGLRPGLRIMPWQVDPRRLGCAGSERRGRVAPHPGCPDEDQRTRRREERQVEQSVQERVFDLHQTKAAGSSLRALKSENGAAILSIGGEF
jgi:hypothetical protein